jgi:hypothetical protein
VIGEGRGREEEAGGDTGSDSSEGEEWQGQEEGSEVQGEEREEAGPSAEEQGDEPQGSDEQEPEGEQESADEQESAEEQESVSKSRSGALAGEAAAGPSMGPHTDVSKFREGREESLEKAAHASDTDAMGKDKRRQVVGGTYGMTRTKLFVLYGTTVAVIAAAGFGLYLLAKDLDQPPEKISAEAPWAEQDAPQRQPKALQ